MPIEPHAIHYDGPKPPVPEPLRGLETGTFTHYTITTRFLNIAANVIKENDWPAEIQTRLEGLIADIPYRPLRLLRDTTAPDAAGWERYLEPYLGQNWLEAPWFFVENYFYRRILEATGYFQPGPGHDLDPYIYQKRQGLETSRQAIQAASSQLNEWLENPAEVHQALASLFLMNLWGNQADLSMWDADQERPNHQDTRQQQSHLLVDDTQPILDFICGADARLPRVDFLVDNAGLELVYDLCLADFLLSSGTAETVRFHLKIHPTFVSDAMVKDVHQTVAFLADSHHPESSTLAQRLDRHLQAGRLRLETNPFWTSPLEFWKIPSPLHSDLVQSSLILSKGDAHYRRLLGDRHWPFTTPIDQILRYVPAPLAALRVCKSEVVAGLPPGMPETLDEKDPQWLFDGEWGLIQFVMT